MKILCILGFLLSMAVVPDDGGPKTIYEDEKGTIKKVAHFGYAIVPDSDKGTRFVDHEMDERFKQDGLRVIFSGEAGDANERRRWATPFTLTKIEELVE